MLESTNSTKPVTYLQQLKAHHKHFCLQRDQTQATYQQLVGAIFACEMMIKEEEENLKKQLAEQAKENQGAIDDGQTESKGKKQAA